jgi:hypothetical protein
MCPSFTIFILDIETTWIIWTEFDHCYNNDWFTIYFYNIICIDHHIIFVIFSYYNGNTSLVYLYCMWTLNISDVTLQQYGYKFCNCTHSICIHVVLWYCISIIVILSLYHICIACTPLSVGHVILQVTIWLQTIVYKLYMCIINSISCSRSNMILYFYCFCIVIVFQSI